MQNLAETLIRSWERAADDLGFLFTPRFHWISPDARRHTYLGLVAHFGRRRGTLVRILQLGEFPGLAILDDDFAVAKIGDRFVDYRRALWVETLENWQWNGPQDKRPTWLKSSEP